MIGLVTDSTSQLPAELAARYGVAVVPVTVTVDGTDYLEGEDLDADGFYRFFETSTPTVKTSQPSPGRFADAYDSLARRGADEILSIHVAATISGTLNSARLAAAAAPVPVHVVDSGTVSFGVACSVWEAAETLAAGGAPAEAAAVAARVGATVGNVFTVRALDLARAGGRLRATAPDDAERRIHVLTMIGSQMDVIGAVETIDEAANTMAAHVRAAGTSLRAGVGFADRAASPLSDRLHHRLRAAPEVTEVVRYRVGPSVGAHTGPGTVGAMYYESS